MSRVLRIAARGDGVTEDGRHVPLTAPGDWVDGDGVVTPGVHHQPPPCRHFPSCGGCQLQHLDEASWATFLRDRVASALAAQGLEAPLRPPAMSPPRSRRRATLHAERKGRVLLGFSVEGSNRLIDLTECHILAPPLWALVAPLRALLARLSWRGRVEVQVTLADQGVDLLLKGVSAPDLAAAEALTDFADAHRLARLAIDEGWGAESRWEPQPVTITLSDTPVPLPPGAFLQATAEGEAALVAAVREAVGGAATVADLFAGLGTFGLALASAARVVAAEAGRDAALALKTAAARRGLALAVEHRDLYRRSLQPDELNRFDAVVLDPPRAGAREQVLALAAGTVPRVAYVSCNPSSFARDAKILVEGGYQLQWVDPVGQFRWSTHVELAGCFIRQR